MALSLARMFSPWGPMATPASTIPTMCGMRSRLMMIGANSIMHSITKNVIVGDVIGRYVVMSGISFLLDGPMVRPGAAYLLQRCKKKITNKCQLV